MRGGMAPSRIVGLKMWVIGMQALGCQMISCPFVSMRAKKVYFLDSGSRLKVLDLLLSCARSTLTGSPLETVSRSVAIPALKEAVDTVGSWILLTPQLLP